MQGPPAVKLVLPGLEIQIRPVAGPRDAVLALDAGDGTQVLVDGTQVTIVHLAECRPRHNLQQWGNVVRVCSGPDELFELFKSQTRRMSGSVRSDVPRDERGWRKGNSTRQIAIGIDFLGHTIKRTVPRLE